MEFFLERISQSLVRKGNKKRARNRIREVEKRLRKSGYELTEVEEKLKEVCPKIRLVDRKKGATTYKLPTVITEAQSKSLAMRWFLKSVKDRKERSLEDRVYGELKALLEGESRTEKRKEEYYKLAIHNRGFLRFLRKRRR